MLPLLIAGAILLALALFGIVIKFKGHLDEKRAIKVLGGKLRGKVKAGDYNKVDIGLRKLAEATFITKPFRTKPISRVEHVTASSVFGTVYYKGQKIDTFKIECDSVGYDIQVGTILTIKI